MKRLPGVPRRGLHPPHTKHIGPPPQTRHIAPHNINLTSLLHIRLTSPLPARPTDLAHLPTRDEGTKDHTMHTSRCIHSYQTSKTSACLTLHCLTQALNVSYVSSFVFGKRRILSNISRLGMLLYLVSTIMASCSCI